MTHKALKITFLSLIWVVGILVLLGAGLYWRLNQGPISLAFMGTSIEDAINGKLPGIKIKLGETELELDSETRTPNIRVLNLVLYGADGQIIASAPKAGVSLETSRLLEGTVSVKTLDLIGPRINARRNLDGSLELGIETEAAGEDQEIDLDGLDAAPQVGGKADGQSAGTAKSPLLSGSKLLALLDAGGKQGALSSLEEVRISRAAIRLFDEANDATWNASRADLAFRRVESGFVIAAKADVASKNEPWKIETSVTFRRSERNYTANVVIDRLVPAYVAENIYALSQFAKVDIPFSGNFEINATEAGEITGMTGQLSAAAGRVNLPEYLSNPIIVDEGELRLKYEGAGKPIEVVEASILMGGSRADLKGKFEPKRAADGRLLSVAIDLAANNLRVDTQGTIKDPVFVDRVTFVGVASIEEQRVEITDLVVMANNTGVRLRGMITGGEESPGINIAGRLRDVSAALLKKLWPPIVTPRTRTWITDNIKQGVITEGTFQINFPANTLAKAQRTKVLPTDVVQMDFEMRGVETSYFKSLPLLRNASGSGHLKGDKFTLQIDKGHVDLESGAKVTVTEGSFEASDLLSDAVPGSFKFDIQGGVADLLEYAALPDLKLATGEIKGLPNIGGLARALISLDLPLVKNVPRDRVKLKTVVSLKDASLKSILPGVDLTDGQFEIGVEPETITVKGPAKVNGIAAKVFWQKPRGKGQVKAEVETVLDAKLRAKLGLKLEEYMTGDVPVKVSISGDQGEGRTIDVEANLSAVAMKVAAAGWSRAASKGTTASFQIVDNGADGRSIQDLKLDGKGLKLRGSLKLRQNGGLKIVDLTEIRLSEDDVFTAKLEPGEDATNLTITGNSFDGRPYIKNLISPAKGNGAGAGGNQNGPKFIVVASFKEIIAHRGESVRNVKGTFVTRGGQITTAVLEGEFLSGLPLTIRLTPTDGGREMRVATADGGAALRAANFYSKIAGGELQFYALMANAVGSPIRNGELLIRRFEVRDEAALAELDSRGRAKKSGPRKGGIRFKRLTLPFTTDAKFVRLCNVELRGDEMGGIASGLVRKADGAIDISGTMIPAQGLTRIFNDVPLLGQILGGTKGEGIFGITFAMGGTIAKPKTQVNPLSVLAPGIFREMFKFEDSCGARKKAG